MSSRAVFLSFFLPVTVGLAQGGDAPEANPESSRPPFGAVVLATGPGGAREVTLWKLPVGVAATRRQVLGASPWNADALDRAGRLLRWQVPPEEGEGAGPYRVRLMHLDSESFEFREILRARQVQGVGASGDRVYLDTSEGPMVVDTESGVISTMARSIELLAKDGDHWLVQTEGQLARFDAATGQIEQRYPKAAAIPRGERRGTQWDGGRFVVRGGGFFDEEGGAIQALEFGVTSTVFEELRICDLETGDESAVRRRILATGGSGVGVVAAQLPTELVANLFRYVERRPDAPEQGSPREEDLERDALWITIDVATGEELHRTPYQPRPVGLPDTLEERGVPESLREAFEADGQRWPGDAGIARLFLEHSNIDVASDRAVCRTADGHEILILAGNDLHHCNLLTHKATSWRAPAAWGRVIGLHLFDLRGDGAQR